MSGIEIALAIPGLMLGAVQTYDASLRIIERFKAKRRARQAPPPSIHLENSLLKGRKDIQEAVASGVERFGNQFAEGDDVVNLALLQIENQIQRVLLEKLAAAVDDDNFNDFGELIDVSDSGQKTAIIAINEYFLRKQKQTRESSGRPAVAQTRSSPPPQILASYALASTTTETALTAPVPAVPTRAPTMATTLPRKRPAFGFFNRSSRSATEPILGQTRADPTAVQRLEQSQLETSDRTPNIEIAPRLQAAVDAARPSQDTDRHSNASFASTAVDTSSLAFAQPSKPNVSRRTSYSSYEAQSNVKQSNTTPITTYGGCCEGAHLLREGRVSRGLMLNDRSPYGCRDRDKKFVYACKTKGCHFELPAIRNAKNHWVFDDKIRTWHSLEYRWSFLAKSHVNQKGSYSVAQERPRYRCLVCLYLRDDTGIFHDHGELFTHLVSHAGTLVGDTRLEGPVAFSNLGVTLNGDFDITFPEVEIQRQAQSPLSLNVVFAEVGIKNTDAGSVRTSMSHWSETFEENVWVS